MCVFGLLILLAYLHFISEHRWKGFFSLLCVCALWLVLWIGVTKGMIEMGIFRCVLSAILTLPKNAGIQDSDYQIRFKILNYHSGTVFVCFFNAYNKDKVLDLTR